MKLSKLALVAALACGIHTGNAFAAQNNDIQLVSCDCGEPVCGCEAKGPSCDKGGCGIGGCDSAGCNGGCDSACGCGTACDINLFGCLHNHLHCDEVGDPWKLFGEHCGWSAGGWSEVGYHSSNNTGGGILGAGVVPANFNNYADRVQLQQQWLYLEKATDGSNGLSLGGRIDYLYGTDAPDTQAFGIANNHWDNSWDNGGAYGHAIPQLYGEVAYGDTTVKLGHFFTIVGNEVVAATGNFFYSRQFTFYNAEPFTHTGVLATHQLSEDTTLYGGYVMGWDSGFEDNGDLYIGGIGQKLTENVNFLYTTTIGRINDDVASPNVGERGSVHCAILTTQLTDKLTNLIQVDYLDTEDAAGNLVRQSYGFNNYFIYQMSDRVGLGSRTEYFSWATPQLRAAQPGNSSADLFNQTFGINYRANANLMIRPEMRWIVDYDNTGVNEQNSRNKAIFGMDAIFTF